MAQFSSKERLIARALSATPRLKAAVKRAYVTLNYILHRKTYKIKLINVNIEGGIEYIGPLHAGDETFYGYYDHSPENVEGLVVFNETPLRTSAKPSPTLPMSINVYNLKSKHTTQIGRSTSFNWQQGCRAMWVGRDKLVYNMFDGKRYVAELYDTHSQESVRRYPLPVQDSFGERWYLSVNYSRIMRLRPDYGYRNLPLPKDAEMKALDRDGIFRVEYATGKSTLIVSLAQMAALTPDPSMEGAMHKANHVMISPDGKHFIFIHRWYEGGRRHDRLLLWEAGELRILSDERMVSHMCWTGNESLFGYLRHDGKDGFWSIDLNTGDFTPCDALNDLGYGDGHPSCHGDWIMTDSYPDKSRMQHLTLFNRATGKVYPLIEVFHGLRYSGESRCDLHPRFSPEGTRIYFDTVQSGRRTLSYIQLSHFPA